MNLAVAIAKAHEAVDLNNEARTELLTELARKPDDVGLHASLAQLERELDSAKQKAQRLEAAQVIAAQVDEKADIDAAHGAFLADIDKALAAGRKKVQIASKIGKALAALAPLIAEHHAVTLAAYDAGSDVMRYSAKNTNEWERRVRNLRSVLHADHGDMGLGAGIAASLRSAGLPAEGNFLGLMLPTGVAVSMDTLANEAQRSVDKFASIIEHAKAQDKAHRSISNAAPIAAPVNVDAWRSADRRKHVRGYHAATDTRAATDKTNGGRSTGRETLR